MGVLLAIDIHLACNQSGTGDTIIYTYVRDHTPVQPTTVVPTQPSNPLTLYGHGTIRLHSKTCMHNHIHRQRLYQATLSSVCVCVYVHVSAVYIYIYIYIYICMYLSGYPLAP